MTKSKNLTKKKSKARMPPKQGRRPKQEAELIPNWEERAKKAIALLDKWMKDESGYDEETWPILEQGLRENPLSLRRPSDG